MIARCIGLIVAAIGGIETAASFGGSISFTTFGSMFAIRLFTALTFIIAGLMLSLMAGKLEQWQKNVVVAVGFFQVMMFIWYVHTIDLAVAGIAPPLAAFGPPSLGTVLGFFITGTAGISKAFNGKYAVHRAWMGLGLLALSIVALVGHISDIPSLYWEFDGRSVAMAPPTVLMFGLLAIGMLFIPEGHGDHHADGRG